MSTFDDLLGTQKRFAFTSKAVPAGTFAVVDLAGTEAISKPYEFDLTLISENKQIALESVLDQPATLTIYPRERGQAPVQYHGHVKEFDQSYQVGTSTLYRVVLTPRIWDLSLDTISEVYLDQSTPQIIDKELRGIGLSSNDFELQLSGAYKPWPYLCQYQEADLDFITRLMEREGIYYYFEQGAEREKMIVTDSKTFHSATPRSVEYRPASQMETGLKEDVLRTWLCKQRPLPRKVVLQDYNSETAAVALMAEAEVSERGKGEVRIYNEDFRVPAEGQRLAKIRAEELVSRQRVFHGEGNATGLQAGFFVQLRGHYRPDFNGRYLVTEVRHEGSQSGVLLGGLRVPGETEAAAREDHYRSECTAIPADVQFRPERLTRKSRIHGTMTAFVDAEGSGEYAELDQLGRYKVQLPFDKTDKGPDKASAWIRMASPYAGKDHGMHFPLHKGAEVLLSFVDGDPNQPIIVGAVPNSETPNLVTRKNQTQSVLQTAGNNMIVMEDQKDNEKVHISSPKGNSKLVLGATSSGEGGANEAHIYSSTLGDTIAISQGRDITVTGWYPPGGSEPTDDTVTLPDDLPYGNDLSLIPPGVTIEYNNAPYKGLIKADFTETVTGNFNETHLGTSTEHLQGNVMEIIGVPGKWADKFEMIWGAEQGIVMGPKVDTALAGTADFFLGALAFDFSLGVALEVHVGPAIDVHNTHINATDNEIKAINTHLEATNSEIQAANNVIHALNTHVVAAESNIRAIGNVMQAVGTEMRSSGTSMRLAGTEIEESGTDVSESGTDIVNSGTSIRNAGMLMQDASVQILG